jgi:DNA repair protein SbcC/Rad50
MRPIRLEVEGFTCYRDRQTPLEFAELSLFAIAGPTGAGKSSILDTMLYALYGQVPRLGKQGIGDVISHSRDALSVLLDFEVQKVRYRVVRRAKKRSKGSTQTTATLVELAGDVEKPLVDGVRDVNEALEKLLGLGYDEFIQTVILPQNEFARFLKSEPKGQREILQHLLRHGVFERMRAAAEERRRAQDSQLSGLVGQLTMCEHATAEALAACAEKLADARMSVDRARAAKDEADLRAQETRHQRQLTREAEELRAGRDALNATAPDVEHARRELKDARRAAEVLPRLEALQTATGHVTRAAEAHNAATRSAASLKKTRDVAAKAFAAAQTSAQAINDLTERLRRLDGIAGDLATRQELDAMLRKMPAHIDAAAKELKTARDAEETARTTTQKLEARLDDVRQAYDGLQFDETLHARLDAVRDDVMHAKALLRERDSAAADARSCVSAHVEAQRNGTAAKAAEDEARERKETAERAAQAALAALEDGRTRHRAATLRAHLHAGDNCPVCLQTVDVVPPLVGSPELDTLEAAARIAAEQATAAAVAWQTAALAHATASMREAEADKARRAASAKSAESAAAFAAAVAKLADVASVSVAASASASGSRSRSRSSSNSGSSSGEAAPSDPSELPAWLDERRAVLQTTKLERDRRDAEVRQVKEALAAAQVAMANAAAATGQKSERHDRITEEQSRLQADLASSVARIEAVTTHPDPSSERDSLAREIEGLRSAVHNASDTLTRADLGIASADAQVKAAAAALADARDHAAKMRELAEQALAHAGFASAAEATAATRDARQREALEERVSTFERKRAAILERLGDVERQIAGREVSAAALAEAEGKCKELESVWLAADQAVVRLAEEHARLLQEVERREQLLTQRRVLDASLSITAELATDLRGDRFQEYLLEEAFETLVASASVRMHAMSNRYTLGWEAGEFYVVDHDNAGERRRAETLSGGEMFMASLCLALELGEEVLRTSGALQMDSLFIDEGFGTLDSDSLSEVTDAIESLRQDGGRLIGVISHRRELTDRLPGCIRVDKGVGESRWHVERVG